jgi:hypothetical protein
MHEINVNMLKRYYITENRTSKIVHSKFFLKLQVNFKVRKFYFKCRLYSIITSLTVLLTKRFFVKENLNVTKNMAGLFVYTKIRLSFI